MKLINNLLSFDRNDEALVNRYGKRKTFFTGGNSSCRQHIRQHYAIYQERCKDENIPEHHWAMPRPLWRQLEDEKRGKKLGTQGTLDGLLVEKPAPVVFTRENVLHVITQFIAVDNQVRLTVRYNLQYLYLLHSPSPLQTKQHFEIAWLRCDQNHPCLICRQRTMWSTICTMSL